MNETAKSPVADAQQSIGAYMVAFSRVDHELGESVKAVFGLVNNEASDAIVAALGDVARKASLVWAASKRAKNADGSEASAEWKAKVEATVKRVLDCNNQDRVPIAHSLLQPNADGSVELVRLKIDGGKVKGRESKITWSQKDFREKTQRLDTLAEELKALNGELQTFKYEIPPNLGWSATVNFEPTMSMAPHGMPVVLATTLVGKVPPPSPLEPGPKKTRGIV
jgi:hypothetical protein